MAALDYQEFEERLLTMKAELTASIARLSDEMASIVNDDDIDDMGDMAFQQSDSQHHSVLLEQQRHELAEVNHALAKLDNHTYGICEESGDTIPVERLRAEPQTRYCIDDAQKVEQRR